MKNFILLSVLSFLISSVCLAQETKEVQVKFLVKSEECRLFYTADEISVIEKECASRMVEIFSGSFKFIRFTTEEKPHLITINLIDQEQDLSSSSSLGEMGFKINPIIHEDLQTAEPVYWIFRSVEQSQMPLPPDNIEFVTEICAVFNQGFNGEKKEDIINNLLSRIELTDDFYFIKDENSGIVPLNDFNDKIGKMSRLLLLTYVESALGKKRLMDTTLVDRYIENMDIARAAYDIPTDYPDRSIILIQINSETIKAIEGQVSDTSAIQKIFIYKHVATPDEASNTETSPF